MILTPGLLLNPVFSVYESALCMILSKRDIPPILMELAFVGIKLAGFAGVFPFTGTCRVQMNKNRKGFNGIKMSFSEFLEQKP